VSVTDLSALLADASLGGAYFVDARDRAAIVEAANALDFVVVAIDCGSVHDRTSAFTRIAQALEFPEWFGANWDALEDCLGDLSWLEGSGYLLLFDHTGSWRDGQAQEIATLIDVLNAVGATWAARGTPFWAVLPLPAESMPSIEE
jgi:RNAse (barnase) inhibitor barstar